MKITKTLRVFLILLSVMMVLPLFACGDTPEETTTKAPEQTTAPKEETTTDKKVETTEPKADATTAEPEAPATTVAPEETTEAETTSAETTEATTESGSETTETGSESSETTETETTEVETTETTAAPECEHVEEAIPAVAPTCTETGLTEGKKCSVCGEILVAQQTVDALGHTEEVVPGKAATCTEDGLTDGKKCSVCNTELVAQQTIPAGHTEETVAGKAATCTEDGLTDGVKCSVCGETITAQTVIPATNHANKIDKAFMAPTTAEDGWEAHTICPDCGKVWDAEGEELEAVPTIEKIVPTTDVYLGVAELKDKVVSGNPVDGNPSQFNAPEVSADRTYVRFSRAGASDDGNVMLLEGNTEATGNFLIIKYKTDHMKSVQFWANTTDNGHGGGKATSYFGTVNDGNWHIMALDLSKEMPTYVVADGDGKYTIQWSRIDLLDGKGTEGYFDIAFVAFCDDIAEASSMLTDGDVKFCSHLTPETPVFTAEGDKHFTTCVLCGEKMYDNHYSASGTTWDAEKKLYAGTCACGVEVLDNMLYKTESSPNGGGAMKSFSAEQKDGFVRYTATGSSDPYIHVYRGGTVVTGQYMVIKYRIVNKDADCSLGGFYSGTVVTNYNGAQGGAVIGDGENFKQSNVLYGDGEWHYLVVVPNLAKNNAFKPNADGTYSWQYLRIGIGGMKAFDGTCYIDIDEIAFADNIVAAESYAYKNDPEASFTMNLDFVKIDGVATDDKGSVQNASKVVDLSGKTLTNAATSLKLQGWCVTPGGVAAYKLRVTSIDGVAVENPELIDWPTAKTIEATDGVVTQGKNRGFGEDCRFGARYYETAVDLSAWAGHTINFEIVIVTNYGAEEAGIQINNVTVPAAQAE